MIPEDAQEEIVWLNACMTVLRTVKQVVGDQTGNRDRFREAMQVLEDAAIIRRAEIEDQETARKVREVVGDD